mmetsp:Transcript_57884/g.108455  ORF Transcript_57884/g.108455 Transcript_57884/m.108455 type:complete len:495 (+) Transcript_57884:347-1831(+)
MHHQVLVSIPCASSRGIAKPVHQGAELRGRFWLAWREFPIPNRLENGLQPAVNWVVSILGLRSDASNLMLQASKDEHSVLTALLADLNVGPVHGAHNQATIHDKLHVRGSTGLRACCGDMLGDVRSRNHHLGCRNTIVWYKSNLQEVTCVWVVVDGLSDIVDELDDDFRIHICRSCLAADQNHTLLSLLPLGRRLLLQLLVTVDDIEDIHELALVLMDALDLDVDQRILINVQIQLLLHKSRKLRFGSLLHVHPLRVELRVLLELEHCFQLCHVSQPLMGAQVLGEDGAQCGIRTVHPTTRSHPVGHVDDLIGLAQVAAVLVELRERLLLDDLGVDGCNAIHLVRAHDRQIAHSDLLDVSLLEDAQRLDDGPVAVLLKERVDPSEVQLANDLHMAREHARHHLHRPLLQRLRHDGVVGVVQALGGQLPCLIPGDAHDIDKQAHHLRNCDRRVRVIHLHRNLLRKLRPLEVWTLDEFAQQVLQRRADEEVLLPQP